MQAQGLEMHTAGMVMQARRDCSTFFSRMAVSGRSSIKLSSRDSRCDEDLEISLVWRLRVLRKRWLSTLLIQHGGRPAGTSALLDSGSYYYE
jgi:hypothetical protein